MKIFGILRRRKRVRVEEDVFKLGQQEILLAEGKLHGAGRGNGFQVFGDAFHPSRHKVIGLHIERHPLAKTILLAFHQLLIIGQVPGDE